MTIADEGGTQVGDLSQAGGARSPSLRRSLYMIMSFIIYRNRGRIYMVTAWGKGMRICRRLFVVPLANNDHGKSTAMNAVISQGSGGLSNGRKGGRRLTSPWGREIDAYVFIRSYQETEKSTHGSVEAALDANDPSWRERELIIFPSHVTNSATDIEQMIDVAHAGGFDALCASFIFTGEGGDDRRHFADIWRKNWDERWTLPNPHIQSLANSDAEQWRWKAQVEAIGRDLWTWICRALAS